MSPATARAISIIATFIREADMRPPHWAVNNVLTIAEQMERNQGGRLTGLQVRVFAAFLLGAAKLPADLLDPEVIPEWLDPEDAEQYGAPLGAPDATDAA